MILTIFPSDISGAVTPPVSKSVAQRAYAAALLCGGDTVINNPGHSEDELAARSIIEQLGARILPEEGGKLRIVADFPAQMAADQRPVLNCGESGLSLRMFTPVAALLDRPVTITGSGSLLRRPVQLFDDLLPALGVACERSVATTLPFTVCGPLAPRDVTIDGRLSSQFVTGLLMAFAAAGAADKSIKVANLSSRPYVELTLQIMKDFNLPLPEQRRGDEFYFPSVPVRRESCGRERAYTLATDWSNAAFLLVAGSIAGAITLQGLDFRSKQGDKKILEVLQQCGCRLDIRADQIEVSRNTEPLTAFHFDARDCPDLFPPLVALAAYCSGDSTISGVHRLIHKESNRSEVLRSEFNKLGVALRIKGDDLVIAGTASVTSGATDAHQDHRIALALSVAALKAQGPVTIANAEAVNKSYPDFYADLRTLGARITTHSETKK